MKLIAAVRFSNSVLEAVDGGGNGSWQFESVASEDGAQRKSQTRVIVACDGTGDGAVSRVNIDLHELGL